MGHKVYAAALGTRWIPPPVLRQHRSGKHGIARCAPVCAPILLHAPHPLGFVLSPQTYCTRGTFPPGTTPPPISVNGCRAAQLFPRFFTVCSCFSRCEHAALGSDWRGPLLSEKKRILHSTALRRAITTKRRYRRAMNMLDRRSVLTSLILVVVGLTNMHAGASAETIDVTVCGKITRFVPASSNANGELVIGGDRFTLAAGTLVDELADGGSTTCVSLTFDATGAITRVAGAVDGEDPSPTGGSDHDSAAVGDSNTVVDTEQPQSDAVQDKPGTARQIAPERTSTGVGGLPVTGGSAPSGPLYAIVSLAAVLLAGFGVFSARRGI